MLARPKLSRYEVDDEAIQSLLTFFAPGLPTVDVDVEVRDPDDAHVVAAALAGGAEAIVTGDRDFLDDRSLIEWLASRGVEVLTPEQLARRLS